MARRLLRALVLVHVLLGAQAAQVWVDSGASLEISAGGTLLIWSDGEAEGAPIEPGAASPLAPPSPPPPPSTPPPPSNPRPPSTPPPLVLEPGCWYAPSVGGEVTIAEGVVHLPAHAFSGCAALRTITLPSSLASIGEDAFFNSGLIGIDLSGTAVTSIGEGAFNSCASLEQLVLSPAVRLIGGHAFGFTPISGSLVIPSSVTGIGYGAFEGTSITRLDLRATAMKVVGTCQWPTEEDTVGAYAFRYCTSLTEVLLPATLERFECHVFEGDSSLTTVSLADPSRLAVVGGDGTDGAFGDCVSLDIDFAEWTGLTSIGSHAFYNTGITSLAGLPPTITKISVSAFWNCRQLASLDLSTTAVTLIEDTAFSGCESLTSVTLPPGPVTIGPHAFSLCGALASINAAAIGGEVGMNAFEASALVSLDLSSSSVTAIGDFAFGGSTSLTSVQLPAGLASIGPYAFQGCTALSLMPGQGVAVGPGALDFTNDAVCESPATPPSLAVTEVELRLGAAGQPYNFIVDVACAPGYSLAPDALVHPRADACTGPGPGATPYSLHDADSCVSDAS